MENLDELHNKLKMFVDSKQYEILIQLLLGTPEVAQQLIKSMVERVPMYRIIDIFHTIFGEKYDYGYGDYEHLYPIIPHKKVNFYHYPKEGSIFLAEDVYIQAGDSFKRMDITPQQFPNLQKLKLRIFDYVYHINITQKINHLLLDVVSTSQEKKVTLELTEIPNKVELWVGGNSEYLGHFSNIMEHITHLRVAQGFDFSKYNLKNVEELVFIPNKTRVCALTVETVVTYLPKLKKLIYDTDGFCYNDKLKNQLKRPFEGIISIIDFQ